MQAVKVTKGRIVFANKNKLILACGADLFVSEDKGQTWKHWLTLPVRTSLRLAMKSHMLSRLLRLGVHHLVKARGKWVAIVNNESFLIQADASITRLGFIEGSRPMVLCASDDKVFYGEYRSNSERSPVHIYSLDFESNKWRSVWQFNDVRHIHGVFHDAYTDSFWVTTGDSNEESGIWCTRNNFTTLDKVLGGSQQTRAVQLLFSSKWIYFGSDTPQEQNFIYRTDREGNHIEKLQPVGGSVFYGCKVEDKLVFSTAVEQSDINSSRLAEVWYSSNGKDWNKLVEWRKDFLSMKYFQYGQVLLPSTNEENHDTLYLTPFAVGGHGRTIQVSI
ncbi:hypothetical protein [Idiomarina zobellii]|uniref:BNR repeat-containing family member n=1 Tax=Idiomarina zobellii TaxID=86103 RepID=A0A837NH76_9GAMM|nr:hypothetical protein [Idiomarina zobellii]KPD22102.1 hypothetical protein AFK76_11270 [Idiomarina zobellii]SDG22737.1 hypothetical protein SAMN04515658_11633 [Idiomarina zobellii]